MGISDQKQTQKSTGSTTASYGWQLPPDTPDLDRLRNRTFQVDPTIGARLGEAQRTLKSSFNNPMGAYTTPAMRDAILRSGSRELMQQGGEEARAGAYDVNRLNYGRDATVAGMTQPRLTQVGSTNQASGTVANQPNFLSMGASLAPLSL